MRRKATWRAKFSRRVNCRTRLDEPMSRHTTLGVGGPVELMAWLDDEESLLQARRFLDAEQVPSRVLGKGSNLLVADRGLPGAALRLSRDMASVRMLDSSRRFLEVEAGGGLALARLLAWAERHGGGGLEGLCGIPGTLGAAVKLNAGTRQGNIGDRLIEVRLLGRGRLRWVPATKLNLGYRRSSVGQRQVVVAARLRLPRMTQAEIKRAYRATRRSRAGQPSAVRSAGCFFVNPEKDSAGRLIEAAGCKGEQVGRAEVSRVHANFIINRGGASASQILGLARKVARRVQAAHGVRLQREVELWGRFR